MNFFIKTFGCQMNEYDSERIFYLLESIGYRKSADINKANIIIFNTCAVREKAKNRLYGHIGNLKKLKSKNPDLLICIGGCTAQNLKEKLLKDFPYIDIVFGTHNISELPELIRKKQSLKNNICSIKEKGSDRFIYKSKRYLNFKAYVPIIIGCNNYCSYCIVPYVRGKEISVHPDKIIKHVKKLVLDGVLEITLLGQNVNSYGRDLTSNGKKNINFSNLLKNISGIRGLRRIRFITSHPKDFSDDIIFTIKENENIAKHIHLPLQSGSDRILKRMNRRYTTEQYLKIVRLIREELPNCSITTDIIVGFPGEDEEDFRQTLNLVKEVRFDRAFTFIYSNREGTKASNFYDNKTLKEKKVRFLKLLEIQNKISLEENKKLIRKKFEVLVEGFGIKGKDIFKGRLENNSIVNFKGSKKDIGKFKYIEIIDAKTFYLKGKLCK